MLLVLNRTVSVICWAPKLMLKIISKKIYSEKKNVSKIVIEYDQEIPQSQTADKPLASWGRANNHETPGRKNNNREPALSSSSRWLQN